MAAQKEKLPFTMYKGYPLVRSGNNIYYGDPKDPYVIFISILATDGSADEIPTKVSVELRAIMITSLPVLRVELLRQRMPRERICL